MATITMDSTEYEFMKKTEKLLQDSLEKERELKKQIDTLNKEKIKAYEDAKMKVVKTTKKVVTQHIMQKRPTMNILARMSEVLHSFYDRSNNRWRDIQDHEIQRLIDMCFESLTSESIELGNPDTIELIGLDDIKAELKKDLLDKLNKDTKKKLEDADVALVKQKELLDLNDKNTKELGILNSIIDENYKVIDRYKVENEKLKKDLYNQASATRFINDIEYSLKNTDWFERGKVLKKIRKYVSEYNDLVKLYKETIKEAKENLK